MKAKECICAAEHAKRVAEAQRLSVDPNLPPRGPYGSEVNLARVAYVAANYPRVLRGWYCPVHGQR